MKDANCHETYTYEKFILYLYLCAAYSDFVIKDDEVEIIRDKMINVKLISPDSFDRNWNKVLHDFQMHNDFESLELLEGCIRHLNLDYVEKSRIYNDLIDIILVDGKEEDSERINLFKFKKILGLRLQD